MEVVLKKAAEKQLKRLNEPTFSLLTAALDKLEKEPPEGDIKKLQGRDGYRVRVGSYRILFETLPDGTINVFRIAPRGGAYKG
jgi:mRNA interferase RelE/StbE